MREDESRALWNLSINAGDERPDKEDLDAGRVVYKSSRKLLVEHLENHVGGVLAAKTRAAIDLWLGWIAALL